MNGEEWEGAIDEWTGDDPHRYAFEPMSFDGQSYVELGSSGGGADKVLLHDDGAVCYFNDFDQDLSKAANTVESFIALLRRPDMEDR